MLKESREAHRNHLEEYHRHMNTEPEKKVVAVQPDDLLSIRLLQGSKYGNVSFNEGML